MYNKIEDNLINKFNFNNIIIVLIYMWYLLPAFRVFIYEPIAFIGIFGFSFILGLYNKIIFETFIINLFFCFVLSFIISLLNLDFTFQNIYANFITLELAFLPTILFVYLLTTNSLLNIKKTIIIFFIIFLITYISTYIIAIINPGIMRTMAIYSDVYNNNVLQFRLLNCGGFAFVYALPIILLSSLYFYLNNNNKSLKILLLIFIISILYFLVLSKYTTVLILSFISIVFYFLLNSKIKIVSLIIIVCILSYIPFLLIQFADIVHDNNITPRLLSINNYLTTGEKDVYISGRVDSCYLVGIQTFLKSPIIGNKLSSYGIDIWHSTVLNYLVKTGIIGFTLYLIIFVRQLNLTLFLYKKSKFKNLIFSILTYVILLAIYNPMEYCYEIYAYLFLFIPLLISYNIRVDNNN